jgi:hypothetical protein
MYIDDQLYTPALYNAHPAFLVSDKMITQSANQYARWRKYSFAFSALAGESPRDGSVYLCIVKSYGQRLRRNLSQWNTAALSTLTIIARPMVHDPERDYIYFHTGIGCRVTLRLCPFHQARISGDPGGPDHPCSRPAKIYGRYLP